ncbi:TetR/AcrR family transcriptional regulator [Desertihabitans brevis]|uniref:TetR/AcrR family transcriptional regulator n=1 Tax=Desertihabitans brevis TaxID=2268447 RepID=A0A367YX85_9ACTN|nr:TetR/AcrR family transcriptional regulator [Desertihabitans brevis]RCK70515.1 TetR/AcrR family transcriptional regulator [Desertihabitans brevis]
MPRSRTAYHHGNLRQALLEAALELTRAGGPAALVVREMTARAGVSPNAAYRHFADRDALLAAVVEQVQARMAEQMAAPARPAPDDPDAAVAGLRAVGLGYIEFALREPGWFEVAFATPRLAGAGDLGRPAGSLPPPLRRLVEALDDLVAAGLLHPDRRPGAEWPCWSAVHGFALLALQGPLREVPAEERRAAAARTVDAVVRGLLQQ